MTLTPRKPETMLPPPSLPGRSVPPVSPGPPPLHAAGPPGQPDLVVPVPPVDAGQPDRVVYIMMRFDAVLDVPRLETSLASLLSGEHGNWRRLGARLRRSPRDGRLEYHIPAHYSPARPAVAFSHDRQHAGVRIAEHPAGRQLRPAGDDADSSDGRPYVACNVDDFVDWMRPPAYPETTAEYLASDAPLLGVRVVSFGDATLVTLAWLHMLSDIIGVRELLAAWVAVLEGRPHDIRPVNDVVSDWSSSLGPPPPQPTTTTATTIGGSKAEKGKSSSEPPPIPSAIPVSGTAPSETATLERRFVCFPAEYMKRLAARATADLEEIQQRAEDAPGDECGPLWVSSGDLVGALIARICLVHADEPPAPDDGTHILNAASIREALEGDIFPAGTAHVGNAVTGARAELKVIDVLTKPLAYTALAVRRALRRTMNRETLVPLMAALVGQPARTMQNRGGQTKKTYPVFITNWSKARLYEMDFSAAVVPGGADSQSLSGGHDEGGGRPSFMLWHASGGRLRIAAIVIADPHGAVWWSCQLPKDDWAKLERNLATDVFEDNQAVAKVE